jgi:hypothetical protein
MSRRLSTCFLAFSVALLAALGYGTAGAGRAGAAAGGRSWDGAVDTPALAPAGRTLAVRSGRPSAGPAPARVPFATLTAPSPVTPLVDGGRLGAPSPGADQPSVLLGTTRSSRGPPARPFA